MRRFMLFFLRGFGCSAGSGGFPLRREDIIKPVVSDVGMGERSSSSTGISFAEFPRAESFHAICPPGGSHSTIRSVFPSGQNKT
jgi:hypothetical protein